MNKIIECFKTPKEKLDWIMSRDVDPRLSQINGCVSIFNDTKLFDYTDFNRRELVLYTDLAEWIDDWLQDYYNSEDYSEDIENLNEIINIMYEDIIQNDNWGFFYDW